MLRELYRDKLIQVMNRLDSSFYFYDLDHLQSRLETIVETLDPSVKLWYACKANPLSAVLKVLRNLNFGFDIASKGELEQVLSAGVMPKNIVATGPSKTKKYLRFLLENNVHVIVLESLNQARWLHEAAGELGSRPKVLLRIQLDWDKGRSVLGGGEVTPFGIGPNSWMEMINHNYSTLQILGFHAFQWGNLLDLNKLRFIWWKTGGAIKNLANKMDIPCTIVDLGGGLGIDYEGKNRFLEFRDVNNLLREFREYFGFENIWMELGRYVVGESGYYFTQVVDKKTVRGKHLLVVDGGINHMARPALTGESFPAKLFRESKRKKQEYTIHGPLCTALDNLGTFFLPEDVDCGDWIVFSGAGAYSLTESMPFFLCHNLPAEVIFYKDAMMIPRPVKTSSDWSV